MRAAVVVAALLGLLGTSALVGIPAWAITTPGTPITVGASPVGVTFNPAGTLGYVTINSSNRVDVIDAATGTLLTPITVGSGPMGIAFVPDGSRAYVANYNDDSVTVIDPVSRATLATITVGDSPFFIAMSPDGSKAYVANSASASVSVINTATNTVSATIPVGLAPVAVAFNPAGTRAYVANGTNVPGGNSVSVINVTTSTIVTTITITGVPYGLAVSPDGTALYVSRVNGLKVSVVDTATNTVTTMFTLTAKPEGVTFSPDGTRVYVPTQTGGVTVIDATTRTLLASLPSGSGSRIMAFTPDGTLAYVTNNLSGTVSVFRFDNALPTITGSPAPGTVGTPYTFTPAVTGTAATVSVFSGLLPPGLTLVAGSVTGTPTTAGSYPVTLRASNANGSADLAVTFVTALPVYTVTFDAAGGAPAPGPQQITQGQKAVEPAPPPTLNGNAFDGWWKGGARWNFAADTVNAPMTLTAHWLLQPTITGDPAEDAPFDTTFSWSPTIVAVAGYSVGSSPLPPGLLLDPATGIISGAPSGPLGPTSVTVTVTDANGAATFTVTITVVHGAARTLTLIPSDATPNEGDTITVVVLATDSGGNTWDTTSTATITSNVATDVIVGDHVTFPHASPHRLTATAGGATASVLLQVTAAARILGLTGGTMPWWLSTAAITATLLGVSLVITRRRRLRADV